ncbi:hypothetical protein NIES4071_82240 [Calothrix sp. NIES-4071]|nr:hypothetical protein NIES4071_82240 [Calothrix sp. NIES-4071]BAZ62493.1 hypothetical protein NIES4105_82170 [Calothrix sp. NIES-4105]
MLGARLAISVNVGLYISNSISPPCLHAYPRVNSEKNATYISKNSLGEIVKYQVKFIIYHRKVCGIYDHMGEKALEKANLSLKRYKEMI